MRKYSCVVGLSVLLCTSCMGAVIPTATPNTESPTVTIQDFESLEGEGWSGTLSYLNYNSDERSQIPVKLAIKVLNSRKLEYAVQYPGEEEYNAKEVLKLSKTGTKIDGATLTKRELNADGTLILKTEAKGKDDSQPADIQMIYFVSPNVFRIQKNVKFEGDSEYFNRNEYSFTR